MSTTTTLSSKEIQLFVTNNPNMDAVQIANELGIKHRTVTANIAVMTRRQNELNNSVATPTIEEPIDLKARQKAYQQKYYTKKKAEKLTSDDFKALVKPKAEKNTYKNADGENKKVARNVMIDYIANSGVIGLIPSLPHIECQIEQAIDKRVDGNSYLCVERERETFLQHRQYVRKNKLGYKSHNGNMSDLIYGKLENSYAHMILDYCGELSTTYKEIEYAIEQKLVVIGGYLCITIAKPIRSQSDYGKYLKDFGDRISNCESDCREMSDTVIEAFFYNRIGRNYKFVEIFNYMDKYPMTLIVLKRIS